MKRRISVLLLAAVLLAIPMVAQEAAVVVPDATTTPLDNFALKLLPILAAAFTITKLIDGMKNHPFFGALFVKVKNFGAWLSFGLSFLLAAILCWQAEGGPSLVMLIHCLAIAAGTALLAAGFNAAEKRKLAAASAGGARTVSDDDVLPPMRKAAGKG